ncbi:MAG: pseudouridine synthase [Terracidiphilus sp.]|jgi:23S rRNA pseudouridine2605 synthase
MTTPKTKTAAKSTKAAKAAKVTKAVKATKTTKITKTKKTAPLKPVAAEPTLELTAHIPDSEAVLSQGTTSPESLALRGHDFSRAKKAKKSPGALAPEGSSSATPDADFEAEVVAAAEEELVAEEAAEQTEADNTNDEDSFTPQPRPPAKLERLQKILAAAGVASRRSAEGMIEQGRVQVNGKVVTVLGTKADAGRDHIRVDGKLLQGAERLRYFVLNKPKGFVTTVKDPEGRPTVMQFFDKMKERLYPVGRLDYMSEGLLLVTNDGELANRLTKASSGVEKTYLVKVAGQPTESELDILRAGVSIERGKPGSAPVRTSPARIRQVRQGDNPWYEVVLIEGRNRELRKMFEEIGHFVEKIRRVGYGPLVLDQEPGNLRELQPEELERLRLAADGKLRTPKSKDVRRRNLMDAGLLPTVLPKPSSRPRQPLPPTTAGAPSFQRSQRKGWDPTAPVEGRHNKTFGSARPGSPQPSFTGTGAAPASFGPARPVGRFSDQPKTYSASRPAPRPAWKKDDRPSTGAPRPNSAGTGRTGAGRPFTAKPAWKKTERPERGARPDFKRPAAPRRDAPVRDARDFDDDFGPVRPPNLHIEEITGPDRPFTPRPGTNRSAVPRSSYSRPAAGRPNSPRSIPPRPYFDRPSRPSRPTFDRPAPSARPSAPPFRPASDRPERPSFAKPFRAEGGPGRGLSRPFTTSSGQPRPGGARPSSKPGRPSKPGPGGWKSKPSFGGKSKPGSGPRSSASSRPYTPRPSQEGASDYRPAKAMPYSPSTPRSERRTDTGWKPKTRYGGPGKPTGKKRN